MHRFFVTPTAIHGEAVTLAAETAHHLREVLRLGPGAEIMVLDGSGREYRVSITHQSRSGVEGRILSQTPALGEPRTQITLYQATLKGEKFEWLLQKGTEIGISRFVPLLTQRCVTHDRASLSKKEGRWRRIIQEAAEQARRGRLPALAAPLDLVDACQEAARQADLILFLWESAPGHGLKPALQAWRSSAAASGRISLFVGPEGGFSEGEAALAAASGACLIGLGPRILRAETAGLAAGAAILYEMGDM
ncbi:MAG: 16S rRNA (uracil(1498)-N(3))-methyltransferase [Anaerolineae bacterium]